MVAMDSFNNATEQSATTNREQNRVGFQTCVGNLIDDGSVPLPEKGIIKRMDEGIEFGDQGQG